MLASTGSTQVDVLAAARAGTAAPGLVLIAEEQLAGQGRRGRSWVAPARASLTVSLLLRPEIPVARWSWLPLLTGLAIVDAVREHCAVQAQLKWPNDVLVGDLKLAGILAQVISPDRVVLGFGVNVDQEADELPIPGATSLRLQLADRNAVDRHSLVVAILRRLARRLTDWEGTQGDSSANMAAEYRQSCRTLGRQVRIILPGSRQLCGQASAIDEDGQLVVTDEAGRAHTVTAGEVIHVR